MDKEEIVSFLCSEIEETRRKLKELAERKSEAEGPRTSWHSQIHIDIERDIEVYKRYLDRCLGILSALESRQPVLKCVCKGSIVTINVEGEIRTYIIVDSGGAPIGSCQIISSESPIGKAIWGRETGEEVKVNTPEGTISVKVLELN